MRLQIVYDLAAQSTRDVADGMVAGLRSQGHEVWISPVHAYTQQFVQPFEDHSKITPHAWTLIHAAINKVVMGDALLFRPEALIVISGWAIAAQAISAIKGIGIHTALYLTESPYVDHEQVKLLAPYDTVICNELSSVPVMRAHHHDVVYMPHSYNPEIHKPTAAGDIGCDVYFCGTGFTERLKTLAAIDWTGINVLLQGFFPRAEQYGLAPYVENETVKNSTLPAIYSAVPINLNIHRTTKAWDKDSDDEEHITWAESIGPRVFEVLACGGFLITDYRAEMEGFLEDGKHLVVYRDPKHLESLIRRYLPAADERARIAEAGRAAVAKCTFGRRFIEYLLPHLEGKGVNKHG